MDRVLPLTGSRIVSAYVVVQLAPVRRGKRTRGEHGDAGVLAQHEVRRLLTEHGAEVVSSTDSKAASDAPSATITVADMACANRLAAALRELEGIETAYAKPGEELP